MDVEVAPSASEAEGASVADGTATATATVPEGSLRFEDSVSTAATAAEAVAEATVCVA